jgi:hypothetical protein
MHCSDDSPSYGIFNQTVRLLFLLNSSLRPISFEELLNIYRIKVLATYEKSLG